MPTPAPSRKDRGGVKHRRQRGDALPSMLGEMFLVIARGRTHVMSVFGALDRREYETRAADPRRKPRSGPPRPSPGTARWLAEPVETDCWCRRKRIQVARSVVMDGQNRIMRRRQLLRPVATQETIPGMTTPPGPRVPGGVVVPQEGNRADQTLLRTLSR